MRDVLLRAHSVKTIRGDQTLVAFVSDGLLIKSHLIGLRLMSRICVCADQLAFSSRVSEQGLRTFTCSEQKNC
jgi:hypothetical protein